jgi:tetratricopeptide (TPR) repeat protein
VRELRLAVQTEPDSALAWDILSWALAYQTPPDPIEAEKAAREAIKFNPFLGYAQYHLGRALYMQGRFPKAMAAFDRCDELTGKSDVANLGRAQALGAQKRYAEALLIMLNGRTLYASNDRYWLSSFYAGNGEDEKSLAALQKGFELGFRDFPAINADPAFASLRNDPRFRQLLDRYSK